MFAIQIRDGMPRVVEMIDGKAVEVTEGRWTEHLSVAGLPVESIVPVVPADACDAVLFKVEQIANHQIPGYAFGDNEAACDMDARLTRIRRLAASVQHV